MNIGLFGGTFDPPHLGHLHIAQAAIQTGEVDRVIFIPTSTPPHKIRPDLTPDKDRLKMTELMVEDSPEFSTSAIEIERKGLSYTIDTLKELQKLHPIANFRLIIGADMALIFGTWKNSQEILDLAPPLIAARPGYQFNDEFGTTTPKELPQRCREILANGIFHIELYDLSSTQVRNLIKEEKFSELSTRLSPKVTAYIKTHNLYQ